MNFNDIMRYDWMYRKVERNFGLAHWQPAGNHKSKNVPRLDINAGNREINTKIKIKKGTLDEEE